MWGGHSSTVSVEETRRGAGREGELRRPLLHLWGCSFSAGGESAQRGVLSTTLAAARQKPVAPPGRDHQQRLQTVQTSPGGVRGGGPD